MMSATIRASSPIFTRRRIGCGQEELHVDFLKADQRQHLATSAKDLAGLRQAIQHASLARWRKAWRRRSALRSRRATPFRHRRRVPVRAASPGQRRAPLRPAVSRCGGYPDSSRETTSRCHQRLGAGPVRFAPAPSVASASVTWAAATPTAASALATAASARGKLRAQFGGVHDRQHVACRDQITFAHADFGHPPGKTGRDIDQVRLDPAIAAGKPLGRKTEGLNSTVQAPKPSTPARTRATMMMEIRRDICFLLRGGGCRHAGGSPA